MAVEPRPVDTVTKENLLIGLPIVLFERLKADGTYDVPRNLGILDAAQLQKTVEVAQLRNRASGTSVLEREVVTVLEPSLLLQLYNYEPENMRLFLASKTLTEVNSAVVAVTNDEYSVPDDFTKFGSLANRDITTEPLTDLTCAPIDSEAVGVGAGGTFGETTGDFALDFPILVIGDVTSYLEGSTERVGDLVAGTTPLAGEIGIEVGATATSGQITYPAGEAPASGDQITVTYTPSFTFTNLSDYTLDPFEGRLRILGDAGQAAENKTRSGQTLHADYSYNRADETQLKPFTQSTFEGRATIKMLTDNFGINFIWDVPSVSIRVNDDNFEWNPDEFATGSLTMNLLSDPASTDAPYGVFRQFPESAAC